nr:hypothetical protein [Acidocella sp.]
MARRCQLSVAVIRAVILELELAGVWRPWLGTEWLCPRTLKPPRLEDA